MIARFILVQFNNVIAVSRNLAILPWDRIDQDRNWKIALGTINEFEQPEILGMVAEAYPEFYEDHWLVTSQFEKQSTIVPIQRYDSMMRLIRERLYRIYHRGVYDGDLCCLPCSVVVRSLCTQAVNPKEVY